jgi:sulfatase maturation enzyme AslB (radical SAM superfamily)
MYIEVTNCCNLACSFCHRTGRANAFMSPVVFAEILERLKGYTEFISLHVLGEPLLHPDFTQLLAISNNFGLQVNLTTNGTLISRHRSSLLTAPALRQISISLHGLAQVEQRQADLYLDEILNFSKEASRSTPLYVSLRLWNLRDGDNEEALAWNNRLLARLTAAFGVSTLRGVDLKAERGIPLASRIFLNPEQQFVWPHPSAPDGGGQGYCRGLRDHLAILVDGTVVPCCLDGEGVLALGNLLQQPLEAILAGPRARQMHEGFGHQRLVEPLCRRCTYRLRFASAAQS